MNKLALLLGGHPDAKVNLVCVERAHDLKQAPGAGERDRAAPWRQHENHRANLLDAVLERVAPPLKGARACPVLVVHHQVEPEHAARMAFLVLLHDIDAVCEVVPPRVGDEHGGVGYHVSREGVNVCTPLLFCAWLDQAVAHLRGGGEAERLCLLQQYVEVLLTLSWCVVVGGAK